MSDQAIVNAIRDGLAGTTVTVNASDLRLGGLEVVDGTTDARAVVAPASAATEANNGLVVHEPVLGLAADAAVTTDVSGTINARLRGLVNTVVARLPALGQTTMSASMPVTIASNQTVISVGGGIKQLAVEFTRPGDATPYTANDAVNNSTSAPTAMQFTTAGRVVGGTGYIVGAEILHEVISVTPRLRLYLFNTSPALNNDNVGYAPTYAILSAAGFLGVIDFDPMTSLGLSDGSRAQNMNIRIPYYCTGASQIIYGLVQTLDAFTPGNAKKVMVKLNFDQN